MLPVLGRVDHADPEEANHNRQLAQSMYAQKEQVVLATYNKAQAKANSPDSFGRALAIANKDDDSDHASNNEALNSS